MIDNIIHPTHQARLLIREAYLHAHVSSRTIYDPTNRPHTTHIHRAVINISNAKSMLRSNAKSMFNFHFIVIARLAGGPYMFALLEIRQLLTTYHSIPEGGHFHKTHGGRCRQFSNC